ncbi:MAG: hypothetical protein C0629_00290 [Chromatiales bacterium]|jgi:hypothetical protein|nr:DUF1801 domain-containing protein [Chromatiales bacterium]PLX57840.1 MAG: hypothetical protein C0629_00290 [Chromatiales bacterium]
MATQKTRETAASVEEFLNGIENRTRREDGLAMLDLMREVTGEEARMWGGSIVGFGSYHYVYESGREGDAMLTGFSPRKQNLAIYVMPGFSAYDSLLDKLGKHKTGKSCLYINKLADVDLKVLKTLVRRSVQVMRKKYG